jgi:hypothetical protein
MILIPNLRETPFHRIYVELSIEFDQLNDAEHESFQMGDLGDACIARIEGEPPVASAAEVFYDMESAEVRGAVSLTAIERPQSFHLRKDDPPSLQWREGAWTECKPSDVANCISVFLDKSAHLYLEADFRIARASIRADSVITSMIGLKTVAGEEQFLLSGAQFAVRGFPGDTVSWYLTPGSKSKEISGKVVRTCSGRFEADSIIDAAHVARARFSRMILAQSEVHSHVTS